MIKTTTNEEEAYKKYFSKERIKFVADTLKSNNGSWPCVQHKVPCNFIKHITKWDPDLNISVNGLEFTHKELVFDSPRSRPGLHIFNHFIPDILLEAAKKLTETEEKEE